MIAPSSLSKDLNIRDNQLVKISKSENENSQRLLDIANNGFGVSGFGGTFGDLGGQ
jgi:hypothetical protein